MEKKQQFAVLVTTAHRGVFFGYCDDPDALIRAGFGKLTSARNVLYWPAENKGFLGLATHGPMKGARVGPSADLRLRDITSVADCSTNAVDAWETQPWNG